jgi:hypothetical protein
MLECLIVGDSIAHGIHNIRTECAALVQSGINSRDWNQRYAPVPARTTIVSLGTNDFAGLNTEAELIKLREKLGRGTRVYWIMPPIKPMKQAIVREIAREYQDTVVLITERMLSTDQVHPTYNGYQQLAEMTR